jgi:hypothetical protein
MNGLVRVWNDNKYDHKEKFKGDIVIIPAGGYVEMNRDDAVLFKGQFTPMIKNKGGREDPMGFKKIRIDYNPKEIVEDVVTKAEQATTCQACGFVAKSNAGLSAHIRANHMQQMVDDDAREAIQKV